MLAVSSLAWSDDEEWEGFEQLSTLGVRGVELIPRRVELHNVNRRDIGLRDYRERMNSLDLVPVAMQAIFFGENEIHLLKSEDAFERLVARSRSVAELGVQLGAKVGVFGAPSVRTNATLAEEVARELGAERLHRLDDALADFDFKLALEPVPERYGNGFLTRTEEILAMLEMIDAKRIALHLDISCVTLGGGDIVSDIREGGAHAVHFHIAEPDLGTFAAPVAPHDAAGAALAASAYRGALAIEMKRAGDTWREDVAEAVAFARRAYAPVVAATSPNSE